MLAKSTRPGTDSPELPDLGRRLASARLRKGLSQVLVAKRCGLAPSYLSRIENGRIQPTFPTALRIVKALRVSIEEVLGPAEKIGSPPECPVSAGRCLLELMRPDHMMATDERERCFTVREVKLLREIAHWLRTASPDRVRALEVLVGDLRKAAEA
jgi:DNA-binding XRE family transcriptional regulator